MTLPKCYKVYKVLFDYRLPSDNPTNENTLQQEYFVAARGDNEAVDKGFKLFQKVIDEHNLTLKNYGYGVEKYEVDIKFPQLSFEQEKYSLEPRIIQDRFTCSWEFIIK